MFPYVLSMGSGSRTRSLAYWLLPKELRDQPPETLGDAIALGHHIWIRCAGCSHSAVILPAVLTQLAGGLMDWKTMNLVAERADDGGFTSSSFYHDQDFLKKITPEGQLIGTLQTQALIPEFIQAFTSARYSVRVKWEGSNEDATYYIDQSPDPKIVQTLETCAQGL